MYEEREAELDRQDGLDALEEDETWQKPVPHFINSRLEDTKAEKYGPTLVEKGAFVLVGKAPLVPVFEPGLKGRY